MIVPAGRGKSKFGYSADVVTVQSENAISFVKNRFLPQNLLTSVRKSSLHGTPYSLEL